MTNNVDNLCTFKIDITYQDTDIAGVVYFTNYLNYAEKGRSKIFKGLFGKSKFSKNQNWAVRSTNITYLKPTKIDDTLVVKTKIKELRKASLVFSHEMFVDYNIVAVNEIHLLCIDEKLKPTRIEKDIFNKLFSIYNSYDIN